MLNYEYPPIGGGAGNATYYILKELSKKESIKVDLVTSSPTDKFEQEQISDNIRIYKLPVKKKKIHYWTQKEIISYTWKAYKLVKKLRESTDYDLIHAFFGIPCGGIAYTFRKKIPYIISLRGSDVPGYNERLKNLDWFLLRSLSKIVWRGANVVTVLSRNSAELARCTENLQFRVIYNGVDTSKFYSKKRNWNEIRILTVGRLIKRKGINDILEAFALLKDTIQNSCTLTIVGSGNLDSELKQLATNLNIDDKVNFLGAVDHDNMPEIYRSHDVFILASHNEALGNATQEALASGLAMLVTRTGASELIDNSNGLIIEKKSPHDIAAKISELAQNKDNLIAMKHASRRKAEKMPWKNCAKQYLNIYQEIYGELA